MTRASSVLLVAWLLLASSDAAQPAAQWPVAWVPSGGATWMLDLYKVAGEEPTDQSWVHLMAPRQTADLGVRIGSLTLLPGQRPLAEFTDLRVRYLVHGSPVSPWLAAPFTYTLSIDQPGLADLPDGVHDISIDVQAANRSAYTFRPIYLHLARGRAVSPLVPILTRDAMYQDYGFDAGPGVIYVNYADAKRTGRPVEPDVTPWHGATTNEPNLYQEEMAPHTDLFMATQMWWEQAGPPHAGAKFARALTPKWDEDHRGLRTTWKHDRFPFIDGPRGIAWVSPYITGQIADDGTFYFVEAGGPLRKMAPDGTVTTIVGWRVKPGRDPIYVGKPREVVRTNMEFLGTFANGRYADEDGFRTPLDVAIDPRNPAILFVAGYEDQCIWRVDTSVSPAAVRVFAGDVNHTGGFVDGSGLAARFAGPASLVFDPVADVIYVADQDNDAIRRITRAGVVTTLAGRPGQSARMLAAVKIQTDQYTIQAANRAVGTYEVTAAQAATGRRPELYLPQTVRVDSRGNLIVLDVGFGSIRRINPQTFEATHLAHVGQRYESNLPQSSRGWAWLDVDRWGNSGPLDSIYYGSFQNSHCDGETDSHANEAYCWMPSSGGPGKFLFPDWNPYPDGWGRREATDPPHYNWLVAVDPRGAVLFAGGGEHGITRMRKIRATDPVPLVYPDYERGKELWRYTFPSPALKFGWEGHSYLGFADASDYRTASDDEIARAFEFPASLVGPDRAKAANFVRLNAWTVKRPPPPVNGRGAVPSSRR